MEETRAEWPNYCLRQLPRDSFSFRGQPRSVWAEEGFRNRVMGEKGIPAYMAEPRAVG